MSKCREWQGSTNGKGYGEKWDRVRKKKVYIHRWVVAQIHGWDAIEGKVVMHKCDNRACYRYDHLQIGTTKDNNDDRDQKGRVCHGERHRDAALTEQDVLDIREDGRVQQEIADEYGVHQSVISRIKNKKAWARA